MCPRAPRAEWVTRTWQASALASIAGEGDVEAWDQETTGLPLPTVQWVGNRICTCEWKSNRICTCEWNSGRQPFGTSLRFTPARWKLRLNVGNAAFWSDCWRPPDLCRLTPARVHPTTLPVPVLICSPRGLLASPDRCRAVREEEEDDRRPRVPSRLGNGRSARFWHARPATRRATARVAQHVAGELDPNVSSRQRLRIFARPGVEGAAIEMRWRDEDVSLDRRSADGTTRYRRCIIKIVTIMTTKHFVTNVASFGHAPTSSALRSTQEERAKYADPSVGLNRGHYKVRLSGQDVERGTFSQRHFVVHDTETGDKYYPLSNISAQQEPVMIHNSTVRMQLEPAAAIEL